MKSGSRLGALAIALASAAVVPAAAQVEGTPPAPVPPPIYVAPPPPIRISPAPPPAPAPTPARNWASAPEPAPPLAVPLKGKERRQHRDEKQANETRCFNQGLLTPRSAERMVDACDWLLAQPTDPEAGWQYRARTLQFRAVALVNAGAYDMAGEALDQADAIGAAGSDPLYDTGLGLGNEMIRAFILGRQGKAEAALAKVREIRASRPYSRSIIRAADAIETGLVGKLDAFAGLLAARQRIDPEVNRQLLGIYLILGQLEPADAFGDRISLVDPKMQGGWTLQGGDTPIDELEEAIAVTGTRAYVAAATGNGAKSDQLLGDLRRAVSDYIGPDPRAGDKRPSRTTMKRYDERVAASPPLLAMIAAWDGIIALRRDFEAGLVEDLPERLRTLDNGGAVFPAMIELMGRYEAREAAAKGAEAPSLVAQLRDSLIANELGLPAGRLAGILPPVEYLAAVPKFKSNAGAWFWGGTMGYTQAKEGTGEIRTVRFESMTAPPAMVEEMLLMAIANFARTEGKDGFIILTGRTIARSITTVGMWGVGGYTSNAGYESQARAQLVDTASLPPEMAGQEDRIFTVAEIERDLLPRYEAYEARQAAEKAAKKDARR